MSQVSGERSEWAPRARSLLCYVIVYSNWFRVRPIIGSMPCSMPLMGRPAFPFIGLGKVGVTAEEKKKN